ncbi:MAG: Ger(x)C family spore germination protein, partial [Oscillospiraceae bacterium]
MKRYTIWIIILLLSLVFIGNEKSIEITDRALIHAVGIDKDESGYTVTLQVFKSGGAGSDTQIDPSKPNTRIISNTAKTFNEAMDLCENQLGSYLFIGHNQVIVLGSDTDFSQPEELLKYFISNKDSFLGVDIVLAEKTAKEILDVQISTRAITTENFKETIKMYRDKGAVIPSDMVTFLNECMKPDKSACLPVVSVKSEDKSPSENNQQGEQSQQSQQGEEQSGENSIYEIKESAVISGGKIVGAITPQEAQSINLMTNKTKYSMAAVEYNGTQLGLNLQKRDSDSKLISDNGKLIYDVNISVKALIDNNSYTEADKKNIAEVVEETLTKQCYDVYDKTIKEYNADLFDLYRMTKHYYPKLYLEYKD